MRAVAIGLCATVAVGGAPLSQRIDALLRSTPAAKQAFWGIRVVDLRSGAVVYRQNEDRFFVPASNNKLFTSALALTRLGPDHRFYTRIGADATIGPDGTLRGDLRLIGGGDPNLSERVLPYEHKALTGKPLAVLESFADQLVVKGLKRIEGDVVGDDTAFPWDPYPDGWTIDDPIFEHGAPVSALTLNDNAFTATLDPGYSPGEPALLTIRPPIEHLIIQNRTRTVTSEPKRIRAIRPVGSNELIVEGDLLTGSGPHERRFAVEDPALFAAEALLDLLRKRGIEVAGDARALHRRTGDPAPLAPLHEFARHTSARLVDILQVLDKVSQNLHSELVLLETARVRRGDATRDAAFDEMTLFLDEVGIAPKQYNFEDGSGLSRLNLVTPLTLNKLLVYMYRSPHREAWIDLLPIGGIDGTLADRYQRQPAGKNVRAKTGTLTHVTALSGYTLHRGAPRYAFTVLVNNFNAPGSDIRKLVDKISLSLLQRR